MYLSAKVFLNTARLCGKTPWTLPPIILLAAAFTETAMFRSPLALRDLNLDNFSVAFNAGNFWFYFRNSVIIAVASVIIFVAVYVHDVWT